MMYGGKKFKGTRDMSELDENSGRDVKQTNDKGPRDNGHGSRATDQELRPLVGSRLTDSDSVREKHKK